MATLDDDRAGAAPWLLSGPALLLFGGLLLVPLLLTLVLSFHVFSDRPSDACGLYAVELLGSGHAIPTTARSCLRTAGLAFAVTLLCIVLGVPETIVLARMKRPWQSVCLLIVLGSVADLGGGAHARLADPARQQRRA